MEAMTLLRTLRMSFGDQEPPPVLSRAPHRTPARISCWAAWGRWRSCDRRSPSRTLPSAGLICHQGLVCLTPRRGQVTGCLDMEVCSAWWGVTRLGPIENFIDLLLNMCAEERCGVHRGIRPLVGLGAQWKRYGKG